MNSDRVVILFTRIPAAERTKTRLQPFLTGEECCLLQWAFILDMYRVLLDVGADIVVCYAPEGDPSELMRLMPEVSEFFPQSDRDLGGRMYDAIRHALAKGYRHCLLIGSDLPLLRAAAVSEAFSLLESSDVVLCPTEDGGYYLVGMNEPIEEVFLLDEFSVPDVFEKTAAAATAAGKLCTAGASTLDIDNPADLAKLVSRLKHEGTGVCTETRKVLVRIFDRIIA